MRSLEYAGDTPCLEVNKHKYLQQIVVFCSKTAGTPRSVEEYPGSTRGAHWGFDDTHMQARQGQARCARPFGTLDGGAVVRSGVVEGQGELLAGQPGCARSLCRDVFWRGQAFSDEPSLKASDGAVLEDQLPAVALDLLGRSEIQR